jgi:hypothetical protein
MRPLFLDWNLGLGDAIICNGLVRYLAAPQVPYRVRQIMVPCWERNLPTVRHMFSDLPNVYVRIAEGDGPPEFDSSEHPIPEVMHLGINYQGAINHDQWDKAFYDRAGVPFDAKWSKFHVPFSSTELFTDQCPEDFILVHQDVDRGFTINDGILPENLRRVDVTQARVLTDWRHFILNAKEIHCIDSSFMHLAELIPTTGRLFYHKYARAKGNRQHTDAVFRKPWVVIE